VPDGRLEIFKQWGVDKSLKRLRLERHSICINWHRIDPKVPMEEMLGALKSAGCRKIRHVDCRRSATEGNERARKILSDRECAERYNIEGRVSGNTTLVYCQKERLGFMRWSPIGERGLKAGDALQRWQGSRRKCCSARPFAMASPSDPPAHRQPSNPAFSSIGDTA